MDEQSHIRRKWDSHCHGGGISLLSHTFCLVVVAAVRTLDSKKKESKFRVKKKESRKLKDQALVAEPATMMALFYAWFPFLVMIIAQIWFVP